jgi:hypothetical protein
MLPEAREFAQFRDDVIYRLLTKYPQLAKESSDKIALTFRPVFRSGLLILNNGVLS